jgi:hypothetical protein
MRIRPVREMNYKKIFTRIGVEARWRQGLLLVQGVIQGHLLLQIAIGRVLLHAGGKRGKREWIEKHPVHVRSAQLPQADCVKTETFRRSSMLLLHTHARSQDAEKEATGNMAWHACECISNDRVRLPPMGRAGEHMAHLGECEAEEPHAALLATFHRFLPLGQGANEVVWGRARC